jgi:hypothetical protein
LRTGRLAVALTCACVLITWVAGEANSACPYQNGIPRTPNCGTNPNPTSIPSGMDGARMTAADCSNALIHAMASLYAYDDPICHPTNSILPGTHALEFIGDAINYLPPNWRLNVTKASDFQAALYCNTSANVLVLSFRGSASLTLFNRNTADDWFYTNFLQHLGDRPLQYQAAEDVAYEIKDKLDLGQFDHTCGTSKPAFMLTGHSKGGGEAQYSAVRNRLEAIVFNSDLVNPVIFNDWVLLSDFPFIGRAYLSVLACAGSVGEDVKQYTSYFATGRVKDVRMVNDPLTNKLIPLCRDRLPRAAIQWLVDTSTCSNAGYLTGHLIETVVRELHACAP